MKYFRHEFWWNSEFVQGVGLEGHFMTIKCIKTHKYIKYFAIFNGCFKKLLMESKSWVWNLSLNLEFEFWVWIFCLNLEYESQNWATCWYCLVFVVLFGSLWLLFVFFCTFWYQYWEVNSGVKISLEDPNFFGSKIRNGVTFLRRPNCLK